MGKDASIIPIGGKIPMSCGKCGKKTKKKAVKKPAKKVAKKAVKKKKK